MDDPRSGRNVPSGPGDPQSLNRFQYVTNIPTGLTDPSGLCPLIVAGSKESENSPAGQALIALAKETDANVVFPYDGQGLVGSILSMFAQGLGFSNAGSKATSQALDASNDGSAVNVFSFSGGAQAILSAAQNSPNVPIQGIDYLSPGFTPFAGGGPLLHGDSSYYLKTAFTNRWHENGLIDGIVNFTAADSTVPNQPLGGDCGHGVACALNNVPGFADRVAQDLSNNSQKCKNPTVFSRNHPPHPLRGGVGGGSDPGRSGGIPSCSLIEIDLCDWSGEYCWTNWRFVCGGGSGGGVGKWTY